MSNRQERRARKAAVRAGDESARLVKEPKRPTRSYRTKQEQQEKVRREKEMFEQAVAALKRPKVASDE